MSIKEALELAKQFISNGIELGYIRMPDASTPDSAHDTLPKIKAALAQLESADARERVARIIDPEAFEAWDNAEGIWRKDEAKARCWPAEEKAAAILATGLVSDEADNDPLDDLVRRFSSALLEKLKAARVKYGYNEGWRETGWESDCQAHLITHLAKGDPRDVAAYCAFMWHHGWSTVAPDEAAIRSDEREKCAAYRNTLLWAFDRLGVTGGMNANEQRRTMREIGNVLTGKTSPAATYQPNDWDDSAAAIGAGREQG